MIKKGQIATNVDVETTNKSNSTQATNIANQAFDEAKPKNLLEYLKKKFKIFKPKRDISDEVQVPKEKKRLDGLDGSDVMGDKTIVILFIALLESLFKKKLSANEMTKALHENEQLSKEFIIKKLGKAIDENSDLSTQQKTLLNQKLNDRDFMQDFCDKLGIKDENTIQKAKSTKDLLTQLNKLGSINKKGKEKCEQIEARTNSQNPNSLDNTVFNSMIESVKGEFTELLNQNQALSKLVHKIRKQG